MGIELTFRDKLGRVHNFIKANFIIVIIIILTATLWIVADINCRRAEMLYNANLQLQKEIHTYNQGGYQRYSSKAQSINSFGKLIRSGYSDLRTIDEIGKRYCPVIQSGFQELKQL